MLRPPQGRRRTRKWRTPTTPPPPPSAVVLTGHDFNDGGIGPFTQWGGYTPQPVSVIPDPTGSGRGMVAKVVYARPANSPGGRDVNGGLYVPGGNPVLGATFGDTRYLEHDVWLPEYPGGAPTMPEEDQRKLWYVKFGIQGGPRVGGFYPVLWGRVDGSGMELHFISEDNITLGPPFNLYSVAQLEWATWYKVAMEFKLNHEGVADGRVRLWVNDELMMDLENFELVKAGSAGSAANIYEWGIGNQEQWDEAETVDMNDYRLFDNIRFLTAWPGASSPPPATLGDWSTDGMALRVDHDFSDNTMGPLLVSAGYAPDITVAPMPDGSGMGARVRYYRPPGAIGAQDVNRSFGPPVDSWGVTFGWRIRFEGKFYIPRPHLDVDGGLVDYMSAEDQKKLVYVHFDDWDQQSDNLVVLLDGDNTWDLPLKVRVASGLFVNRLPEGDPRQNREHDYTPARAPWAQLNELVVDMKINDKGVANGALLVMLNGAVVKERLGFEMFMGGVKLEKLFDYAIGDQQQCNTASTDGSHKGGSSAGGVGYGSFDWFRYWSGIRFLTRAPGA